MESLEALASNPHTWVYTGFFIFVVAIGPKIWRGLAGLLDQRALKIKSDLDMAHRLLDDAQALLGEYQRKLKGAENEATTIKASAKEIADDHLADAREKLDQLLARREKMAIEKIAQAEANAIAEVRKEAIEVAGQATERMVAQLMTDERTSKLVDQAISDLGRRPH